jgi:hypothetical protein
LTFAENNGFNPIFKTEFKIHLTDPENAIFLFAVVDADLISKGSFRIHVFLMSPRWFDWAVRSSF